MKKVLIISDTHGHLDEKLYKYIDSVDEVWHAGDIGTADICKKMESHKPLRAVWGNIDGQDLRMTYQENLIFKCEDVKVFITHIGGYPGKYSPNARNVIVAEKPNLFICGHSHILKVMYDKNYNLLHINPGAAGISGFHKMKTVVRLEIDGSDMKNLEVIELGGRTA